MRLEDIPFEATRAPEPPAPPLSALWRGQARDWLRFHLADRIEGLAQVALYHALRPMPPELAAALGRGLGPVVGWLDRRRPYVEYMRRAIRLIRPDLDAAGQAALLAEWWRQTGMTHALYPVLEKLAAPGRLTIHGAERLRLADERGGTFFLMVHLGSWELIADVAVAHLRRPVFGVYEPQPSRFQNRLIFAGRRRRGVRVFPPSRTLPMLMIRLIRAGSNACFFIDEVRRGQCRFPLWGAPVPERANLVFALRLAHRLGARLQPGYVLRTAPGRAEFHLMEPIEPGAPADPDAFVRQHARRLSALFEPVIAAHLEQWYMLKDMRR
ncbi:MAG: hypothetical protein D6686_17105 [Alphaproteobacteria bacterium]|nr:MAG: hypothetical protein D6686_17105 [Alphaproteobacteria bacterium]